jgi:hypothetical protein
MTTCPYGPYPLTNLLPPGYNPYMYPYSTPYPYVPGVTPYVSPFINPYTSISPYATVNPLTALLSNPFTTTPIVSSTPFLTYAEWRSRFVPTYLAGSNAMSAFAPFTSPFLGGFGR